MARPNSDDDLDPARGIFNGCLISVAMLGTAAAAALWFF